jgi:hypothetical protein
VTRRFPQPWSAEVTPNCFIVRDHNGQALAYVYFEDEPGRRSAAKLLSKDEARRIVGTGCRGAIDQYQKDQDDPVHTLVTPDGF